MSGYNLTQATDEIINQGGEDGRELASYLQGFALDVDNARLAEAIAKIMGLGHTVKLAIVIDDIPTGQENIIRLADHHK